MQVPIHIKDFMDTCIHMAEKLEENGFPQSQARQIVKIYITEIFDPDKFWDKELIVYTKR
jgi:hypothetical protein